MAYQTYKLSDVTTIVRDLLGERLAGRAGTESSLKFPNDRIRVWFNWAQEQVALETEWRLTRSTTNITASTTTYTIPSACMVLRAVEYKDGQGYWRVMQEVDVRERATVEEETVSGMVYQVFANDTIEMHNAFGANKTNGLRWTYMPRPTTLVTSATVCQLKGAAVEAAIFRCAKYGFIQDKELNMAEGMQNLYVEALERARAQHQQNRTHRLHVVKDVFRGKYPSRKTIGGR